MELDPNHVLALQGIGELQLSQGDTQEAEKSMLQALDIDPEKAPCTDDYTTMLQRIRRSYLVAEGEFLQADQEAVGSDTAVRTTVLMSAGGACVNTQPTGARRRNARPAAPPRSPSGC